ncbi:MFS general substrate transporter [Lentinus tigrinus ALCF2SS1-7]|uniref:MFS general substrate transporter n=1 Tax=Lentinus tigrinus ALCF2SS1-6 TaxID=1328759 RepID=A0A5C2RTF9_9APHY|nr:MFS general substrate transporter [Lentinus tigrinus ALCF2SS1-6]RPD74123.1 MFS general substrate transporter [Lentinus tigrinus ALCF2SS1-7]
MTSMTEPRPASVASSTPTAHNPRAPELSKSPLAGDAEKGAVGGGVEDVDDCPDGGLRAWLVVLGVSSGICTTFGFVNAWGIFQAYYEEYTLRNMSPSDIRLSAWIGSIQYALVFMPGLAFGRLFDMGYLRLPVGLASALLVACTFLTAECKEFWQFLLFQGIGIGLASGIVFSAGSGVVAHWFRKKLGLALACMASGSSIGGTIFPIILRNLIETQSFQWTLRITGFIVAAFLLVLNLTIARRLPPNPHPGPFITLHMFNSVTYCVYCLSLLVGFLGLYTCLTYLSLSGLLAGVDADLSFYLLSIANACSLVGRIGGGVLADRFGAMNVMIPGTLVAGVMTYAWPFAKTKGPLVAVSVLYGVSSGIFVAIMAQPLVRMGKVTEVGMRTGMAFTIMSFGALAGPPISGAIFDHTSKFENVGYFAGSTIMASVALMVVARQLLLGKFFGHA